MLDLSVELITLLMFGVMLLFIATGLPIAFVLGGLAMVFAFLLWGPEALKMVVYSTIDVQKIYNLVSLPLFIYTGLILQQSGVADAMFDTMRKWAGGLRGWNRHLQISHSLRRASGTGVSPCYDIPTNSNVAASKNDWCISQRLTFN